MKIIRIVAHRVELPLHETTYKWSGGKSVTVFDSTIVGVETDAGLTGSSKSPRLGIKPKMDVLGKPVVLVG